MLGRVCVCPCEMRFHGSQRWFSKLKQLKPYLVWLEISDDSNELIILLRGWVGVIELMQLMLNLCWTYVELIKLNLLNFCSIYKYNLSSISSTDLWGVISRDFTWPRMISHVLTWSHMISHTYIAALKLNSTILMSSYVVLISIYTLHSQEPIYVYIYIYIYMYWLPPPL